jgi:crotonobetainyl-CoA:carnitine CoA-transferase CaiB-like acyl-CoA transferase
MQPLAGLRVIDFTHVMAGPFATQFLQQLGAEVIKIEPREGDRFRYYRETPQTSGMVPAFVAANTGKKSVRLNLKHPAGRQIAEQLITKADVVIENFSPGVIDKLGLGYETCRGLNPAIIFCSISGYGQKGPLRDNPAIDSIVQATSGLMSINGEPDAAPLRVGIPIVDTYTGTLAALAILSALLQRQRFGQERCQGRFIDIAMFDAALVMQTTALTPFLVEGRPFPRTGNLGYSGDPTSDCFEAKDGKLLSIGAVSQAQVEACFRALGRADLLADERFATPPARRKVENALVLRKILEAEFAKRPALEWEELLNENNAPCGVARSLPEAAAMPHLEARGLLKTMAIPGTDIKDARVLNAGFCFDADGPAIGDAAPLLGEHTDAILASLGYDEAKRDALRGDGAIY